GNLSGFLGLIVADQQGANGVFNHTGGILGGGLVGDIHLGGSFSSSGGRGVYNLSGTALLTTSNGGDLFVGDTGQGIFNQTGGQATIGGSVILGNTNGASGTVTLSAG